MEIRRCKSGNPEMISGYTEMLKSGNPEMISGYTEMLNEKRKMLSTGNSNPGVSSARTYKMLI